MWSKWEVSPGPGCCSSPHRVQNPPWRHPRGNLIVALVNSHTNATRIGWHLWEIDLRFAPGLPPGWLCALVQRDRALLDSGALIQKTAAGYIIREACRDNAAAGLGVRSLGGGG